MTGLLRGGAQGLWIAHGTIVRTNGYLARAAFTLWEHPACSGGLTLSVRAPAHTAQIQQVRRREEP